MPRPGHVPSPLPIIFVFAQGDEARDVETFCQQSQKRYTGDLSKQTERYLEAEKTRAVPGRSHLLPGIVSAQFGYCSASRARTTGTMGSSGVTENRAGRRCTFLQPR